MPSLSSYIDPEALDNDFIGRAIVYVENATDADIYMHIIGAEAANRIEFKKLPGDDAAGGCDHVVSVVAEHRVNNRKVFGLLDGDAAAKRGGLRTYLECNSLLFTIDPISSKGIFFISSHELENLYLQYSNLKEICKYQCEAKHYGKKDDQQVLKELRLLAFRFCIPSVFGYISHDILYKDNTNFPFINANLFIDSKHKSAKLVSDFKKDMDSAKRKRLRDEAVDMIRRIKGPLVTKPPERASTRLAIMLRIAAGKQFLKRMGIDYQITDGQMISDLLKSAFPTLFLRELESLVDGRRSSTR